MNNDLNRSHTEPSTPKRNASFGIRSLSALRRNINSIRLPFTDLQSLQKQWASESTRPPSLISTPRLFIRSVTRLRKSMTLSPKSPLVRQRILNRRRSSIVVETNGSSVFNPQYDGPITVDYLRFLCKVALNEKLETVNTEKSEVIPEPTDFQLDDAIVEHFQSTLELLSNENPFLEATEPEKPLTQSFSYLERILASQSKADLSNKQPIEEDEVNQLSSEPRFDDFNGRFDDFNGFNIETPKQLIQQEFTVLSRNITPNAFDIFGDDNENLPNVEKPPKVVKEPSRLSRPTKRNVNYSISSKMVRDLIQVLKQPLDDLETKPKRVKIDTDTFQYILDQSDIFLSNLLGDLEAYALHRSHGKGRQINLTDVLLYLNRLKFANSEGSRINSLAMTSALAKKYLPREMIVALDNSLKNSVQPVISKGNQSEEEDNDDNDDSDDFDDFDEIEKYKAKRKRLVKQNAKHIESFSDSDD